MNGQVRILIPCRSFEVHVRRGFEDGLSPMECAVLESIHAGAVTTQTLAEVLGLEPRMVVDTCVTFLQTDLAWVDPESGTLHVSEGVAEVLGAPGSKPEKGWSKRFTAASRAPADTVRVFQDLVSGSVFSPPPRDASMGSAELAAPVRQDLGPIDTIPRRDLLVAVATTRAARKHAVSAGAGPNWVLDVELAVPALPGSAAISQGTPSSITVEAACRWRDLDDELVPELFIVAPVSLPMRVRSAICASLSARYAAGDAREDGQFFARLYDYTASAVEGAPADQGQVLQKPAVQILAELKVRADRTPSVELHEDLEEADAALHEAIIVHERHVAPHALVNGARSFHDLLAEALATASDQVVIANPWVVRLARPDVRGQLVDAMRRGVQVHVLWGIAEGDALPPDVKAALAEVAEEAHGAPGALWIEPRSARTHAKVLVCDARWAVVGSCNFLSSGPERTVGELGLWFGHREPGGHEAVGDVLRWAASIAPSARQRTALEASVALVATAARSGGDAYEPLAPPTPQTLSGGFGILWQNQWKRRIEAREARVGMLAPAVQLLAGAQHRTYLLRALEGAHGHVVVASPHLGRGILGERMREWVRAAVVRGCRVQILHAPWEAYDERAAAEVRRRMPDVHALANAGAEIWHWDSHAKFTLSDGHVALGSFNHLSLEGFRGDEPRARSELSVGTDAPAVVAAVLEHVERRATRWDGGGP